MWVPYFFIDKCSLLLFKGGVGDRSEILRALNTGKWQEKSTKLIAGGPNLTRLSMSKTALIILNMRRCVSKITAIKGVILILSNQY